MFVLGFTAAHYLKLLNARYELKCTYYKFRTHPDFLKTKSNICLQKAAV